jgi:Tfp pilus assembly protein PilO
MEQLTRYRTAILIGVGALVVAAVLFVGVVSPQGKKASNLNAKVAQLTSQQSQLQSELVTLREENAHFVPTCATLSKELVLIPQSTAVSNFLRQVTNLARQSGDPNTPSYSLPQAGTAKGGVASIEFEITLTGTYRQMTAFIQGLTTLPRLFTVSNVNVSGGSGSSQYTLAVTGDIYYSSGQKNVCP